MKTFLYCSVLFLFCTPLHTNGRRYRPHKNGVTTLSSGTIPTNRRKPSNCEYNIQFHAIGQTGKIESPGYPFDYPPNIDCYYSMQSPPGTRIRMNCTEFNIEESDGCVFDAFRFSLTGDLSPSSPNRQYSCGRGTLNQVSMFNNLTVSLHSDGSNPRSIYPYRFQCELSVISQELRPTQPPTSTESPTDCSCGQRTQKEIRIVGGRNAVNGSYPWRCSLYCQRLGAFCGCTIIDKDWILTAAHCSNAISAYEKIWVNVGDHDLSITTEAANEKILVSRRVQNKNYNSKSQDNDITLLQLERSLTFKSNIQPVCLPFKYINHSFSGVNVMATGWGLESYGGRQKVILQEVELPILETEECRIKGNYSKLITNNMFCTYRDKHDTCQGDSGGAIDYYDPKTQRNYVLGVISWGIGCATKNRPGVYSKLINYLDWIRQETATTGARFCEM